MKYQECNYYRRILTLLCALLVAAFTLTACSNPEKTKAEHLSRGEAFLKEKKFQEASLEFRSALQIDDGLIAAHWGLAQAYEGLERFAESFEELKRIVDLDANHLDARVRLGNYYLAPPKRTPEMIAEAERLAKDVLAKDPNHIEGHILMATVLFAQGQRDEALAELNKAVEIDPQRVESYLSLARYYLNVNNLGKAEEAFKRAIATNNASAMAHTEYGRFLAQANRLGEAEAQLKMAVEAEPTDITSRRVLAEFYRFVTKQNDKAEEAYKAVAEVDKGRADGRALLADFYAMTGRLDEAVNIYQDIAAKTPDYARARYRLGEIMLQRGDLKGASAQVDEALKRNPQDMQAMLLRERIQLQSGQAKEAITTLNEVLKQEPDSRAGLYYMAEANYRAGLVDQARSFAGDLERYHPNYLPAKLIQAQINLAANDPKTALRLCNELIERMQKIGGGADLSPEMLMDLRAKTLTTRGSAQLQLGNASAARADLQAARDLAPNETSSYLNLAAVALREGKVDEANSLYERILAIDSTNYDALSGLISRIYAPKNQFDQAHARVDQAISTAQSNQPNNRNLNASLHYLKAQVYGLEKNAQGAETELRRALEINPDFLVAYSALGALFINTNQQERAIAEFRRIIERRPDDPMPYTMIGMLEDSRQNFDAAAENYRRALQLDENAVVAANNLAWIYAEYGKGDLDEAVRLAQGVVQKYPDVAGFADTLGWVYYKKGLHAAAVEQLQKALAKNDNVSPTYRYHLGMALAGKGDKAAARRELEMSLRLGEGKNFAEAEEARKALAAL